MQHKQVKLSALLLLGASLTALQAQDAIPATGGNASGSEGSVSYSIGQVVNTTHTGTNGSVTQGVQQPYEISVINAVEEAAGICLEWIVFPNPASEAISLKVDATTSLSMHSIAYHLFDINGNLLESKPIEDNITIIPIQNLLPSVYFLLITNSNKEVKLFKIIKN